MNPRDYIEYVYLSYIHRESFDKEVAPNRGKWRDQKEVFDCFYDAVENSFVLFSVGKPPEGSVPVSHYIEQMMLLGAIETREIPFAGKFARVVITEKDKYVLDLLKDNPLPALVEEFDSSLVAKALSNISELPNWGLEDAENPASEIRNIVAPGSDRIVTLKDNQGELLAAQADDVINLLERENSIDGDPSLRDRILGQIRAGKELLISGVFKLELLRLSLLESLVFLIKRYEREAVGAAASVLLAELLKVLG